MDHPERLVVRPPQTPLRQQRLMRIVPLRLHEELRERGMRRVRDGRVEHELRIRRHIEPSRAPAQILDRQSPLFGRRVRRERHLERRADAVVLADERHDPFARDGLVRIFGAAHGLRARGPVVATVEVTNVQYDRVRLARVVGRAPRDRERPEVRAPRAVVRDREMIAIVREPMLVHDRTVFSAHYFDR